ncbi:iron-containing alcohol dehydrogenase [Oribacterium sp. HCP28S3_H8]|jgi:alcohol dehydrogenase class IV|uniref:iron-containing alcohol dehydrogenase n=1 Tax=Oribacterium sp. HCP28S3_H8 TaxID=3438945 RepID=UPI0030508FB0|nr:iron-containing alcohol dehydrogenase [Oribacterium sp.]
MSLEKYSLKLPKAVFSGTDSMDNIPEILKQNGVKKVAAFTDKGIRTLGLFDLVEEQLKKAELPYDIYDDFPPEPSYQAVQKVIDQFKGKGYDFIVACGGGSVMDTAKLASILVTDEYGVKELLDDPKRAKKCVPILTIPTTAGTGAECTPNAIVGVPEKEVKIGIVNDNMMSDYVILDARLIKNLPRKIAASTGVDAMCHCIECFTSNKSNPFSDTFALRGFDIIMNNIEKACDDPTALTEKNNMQIAAFYGGVAITASGTTAVHALSYPLGGKYHVAHGVSNAMLLIPVMNMNAEDPAFRAKLAAAWDVAYHGEERLATVDEKAKALIDWMDRIVKHLEIPTDLKEFGVKPEDLDWLVEAGLQQQRLLVNNMKQVTADDARKIYQQVM